MRKELLEQMEKMMLAKTNAFIRDLYKRANMKYDDYVTEDNKFSLNTERNIYYLSSNKVQYSYNQLLEDTVSEL